MRGSWCSISPTPTSRVAPTANPPQLGPQVDERFGPYPVARWPYASPWASARLTDEMRKGLLDGLAARTEVARWLFTERFPDWDRSIVPAAEPHSAAEAFWHGADPAHPLHGIPSAPVAAGALTDTYQAVDRMVGELIDATEARTVLVFSLGG